ncbi:MAG TPA: heavy metal-binding domain-containing protein [Microbacterium sp.]|nr:heavy metal-binding domain-containing protein [Microbacterium sp.]
MNAAGRLSLYAAGVAVAFAGALALSAAVIPDSVAAGWNGGNMMDDHSSMGADKETSAGLPAALPGLSLSAGGYVLAPVTAPAIVGESGELSFQILSKDGSPLTEFATGHGKDLHLIVVRSDGDQFRHVHPAFEENTGTWSLPWQWDEAGTYRVYADFTAGDAAKGVTLSRTVEVAGTYAPVVSEVSRVAQVDDYAVSIAGDLVAGSASDLTISITQRGEPVIGLEPYLGAFGHLVALREGDLAYLHVHADGEEPQLGETAGPEITFMAQAPTTGRYLLYLDFQIDGQVRTAPFVLDAGSMATDDTSTDDHDDESHGH